MLKNALLYRIVSWNVPTLADVGDRLAAARFSECGATQTQSAGWLEPRGENHAALIESIGGHWILRLCTETRAVPGAVVRGELEARLDRVEAETGRRPKGKRAKEIKEEIVHDLLPRAFPKRASTAVWIDLRAKLVIIGAASAKKADAIVTRLVELLGAGIVLRPLQTGLSPAAAMSAWLSDQQGPAGFSIDRECELKQPDSEKATVRYARHRLEIAEVAGHIAEGKLPTQLAMSWNSRVSFVLTETMTLKKIKLLDVVLEGATPAGKADGFDADVAITTGELAPLIADLVAALGGELDRENAPSVGTPAANDEPLAA